MKERVIVPREPGLNRHERRKEAAEERRAPFMRRRMFADLRRQQDKDMHLAAVKRRQDRAHARAVAHRNAPAHECTKEAHAEIFAKGVKKMKLAS